MGASQYMKPKKFEFDTERTLFLGFIISQFGIEMDPEKVSWGGRPGRVHSRGWGGFVILICM